MLAGELGDGGPGVAGFGDRDDLRLGEPTLLHDGLPFGVAGRNPQLFLAYIAGLRPDTAFDVRFVESALKQR
jgi:hypothetical protein